MKRLILVSLLLVACSKEAPKMEMPPPKVRVVKAESQTMPYVARTIGQVTAPNVVDIIPQVEGQLMAAYAEQGTYVEAGDLLFTIDPRIYEAELGQNQGLLEQAQANLRFGEERVARYHELLPEDFVSLLDYEQYVSQMEMYAGQVDQYQSAVMESEVNLGFTMLIAPISGQLGKRFVDPGNIVSPEEEMPIITLRQIEPIEIDFRMPERFLPLIQEYQARSGEGLVVTATVTGEGGKTFKGHLDFIDNTIDTASGTILMRAIYQNEEHLLWPGQFAEVQVDLYEIPNAVVIPSAAIGYDTKGAFAFVIVDDKAQLRRVELGQQFQDKQVISSGIKSGEEVVVDGQLMLRPDVKVQIVS